MMRFLAALTLAILCSCGPKPPPQKCPAPTKCPQQPLPPPCLPQKCPDADCSKCPEKSCPDCPACEKCLDVDDPNAKDVTVPLQNFNVTMILAHRPDKLGVFVSDPNNKFKSAIFESPDLHVGRSTGFIYLDDNGTSHALGTTQYYDSKSGLYMNWLCEDPTGNYKICKADVTAHGSHPQVLHLKRTEEGKTIYERHYDAMVPKAAE